MNPKIILAPQSLNFFKSGDIKSTVTLDILFFLHSIGSSAGVGSEVLGPASACSIHQPWPRPRSQTEVVAVHQCFMVKKVGKGQIREHPPGEVSFSSGYPSSCSS